MQTVNIGTLDNPHYLSFEVMQQQSVNDLYYIIKWDSDNDFIMVWDNNAGEMTIQGVAPYAAREVEESISNALRPYYSAAA